MPWSVVHRGGKYVVVVSEGPKKGKVVSTHDSREKAERHKRALYANAHMSGTAIDRLMVKLASVTVKPHVRIVRGKPVRIKAHKRIVLPKAAATAKAHTGRRDTTTLFGQQAETKPDETPEMKHMRLARERERYAQRLDPQMHRNIKNAVTRYRQSIGLPDPKVEWDDVVANLDKAKKVARRFLDSSSDPDSPEVQLAYAELERETQAQFDLMTKPEDEGGLGISVEFVDEAEPYKSAEEQAQDVCGNKRIKIATISIWPESHHPMLGNERGGSYDKFRAVHDLFGHVAIGGGFDRHGEYAAWLHHSSMFRDPARQAASTELHGENSVLWTTGTPPEHKATLLGDLVATPIDRVTGEWVRFSVADISDEELFPNLYREVFPEGKVHYDGIREIVASK